jgi:phosphotransferase system IIB component|tara:strand:- start:93 stop:530 length:438 start_codon:yes stop_codon:yes gene_type:complete
MFNDLFCRKPINKTSAIQVNQNGCKENLTTEQKLENAFLAKSAIMDVKNKVHEKVKVEGYNLKVINTEIDRLRFVLKNEKTLKAEKLYNEQRAWAKNKKEMSIKANLNEDILIHRELKKILKSQMPLDIYVELMRKASINAGVDN